MSTRILVAFAFSACIPAHLAAQGGIGGRLNDVPRAQAANPKPTPRLADGHPDLGNGKGAWNPQNHRESIGNRHGRAEPVAGGEVDRDPVQTGGESGIRPAASELSKDDPEGLCLPPGIPRMYATPFPFQIFQQPDRVIFIFEGAAHVWREIFTPTDGRIPRIPIRRI